MTTRTAAALLALFLTGACSGSRRNLDMSDAAVEARVRTELKAHPELTVRFLDVDADEGIVHVSGMVETPEQRRRIQTLGERVPGVRQMIVNVVVSE